jgi:hypothetical protein
MWDNVFPAVGDIVVIAACLDPYMDVVAEQAYIVPGRAFFLLMLKYIAAFI